jgi:hypothetical protein
MLDDPDTITDWQSFLELAESKFQAEFKTSPPITGGLASSRFYYLVNQGYPVLAYRQGGSGDDTTHNLWK